MSAYGTPRHVRMMLADDTEELSTHRTLGLAERLYLERGKWYFDPEDDQLSPMHKSIIDSIAQIRYGKRRAP